MEDIIVSKLKSVQINILDDFNSFCLNHKLKYYLTYGTLLGAVRHQGYIPWDDDIDIFMPREDYNIFIKLFENSSFAEKYFLQNTDTELEYHLPFSKIRKKNTSIKEGNHYNKKINQGIFIDIFPIDYSKKNNGLFYRLRDFITKQLNHIAGMRQIGLQPVSKICSIMYFLTKPLSVHRILKISEWWSKLIKKGNYYVNYASYVKCEKETYPIEYFGEPVMLSFENKKYCAPRNSHEILKQLYGDYMVIPPVEKRYNHEIHSIVFDLEKGE